VKFEWNPEKNKQNIIKHQIDFNEAESVFEDDYAIEIHDEKHSRDEDRFIIIGMSVMARELMVCHCYRNGDDIIRIISARKATRNERELYERGRRQ